MAPVLGDKEDPHGQIGYLRFRNLLHVCYCGHPKCAEYSQLARMDAAEFHGIAELLRKNWMHQSLTPKNAAESVIVFNPPSK